MKRILFSRVSPQLFVCRTKNAAEPADLRLQENASALRSSHIADWMHDKVYNEAIIVVICKCVGLLNEADNGCCKWIFNRNTARLIYFTFSVPVPCCSSRPQWVYTAGGVRNCRKRSIAWYRAFSFPGQFESSNRTLELSAISRNSPRWLFYTLY